MANQKGKEVKNSLYKASIEPLEKAEELEVAKKMATGNKKAREKARELLIRANIRYALSCAKKFYGLGLSDEEVNQEAVIGLIKAVDRFDFKRGTKVITFAKWYIKNEIDTACNKSAYIRSISLDEPVSESGETRLSMIPDTASCSIEGSAINHIQKQVLYVSIKKLEPMERDVICMHYGLKDYKEEYSLSAIGEKYQRSRQNIFFIKERALSKLRQDMNSLAA